MKRGRYERPQKSPYSFEVYDSSWEKDYMGELEQDATVKKWTKNHEIRIVYTATDGIRKTYVPDFLVERTNGDLEIIEMKGQHLLQNLDTKRKTESARNWCEARSMKYRLISRYQ